MIELQRYTPDQAENWDEAVARSRNGTFLFRRGFMDYHADRFEDASLMFMRRGRIIALLPQSVHGREWRSHGGLTYGGLLLAPQTSVFETLAIFDAIAVEARRNGIERQLYAPVPYIYHSYPAEEDRYALHNAGAVQIAARFATVIALDRPMKVSSTRRQTIRKARETGLKIRNDCPVHKFHAMLAHNLAGRHQAQPVHSASEMELLQSRFPDRISCWGCWSGEGLLLAGAWMFRTDRCARTQYLASTPEGRDRGALDLLISDLLSHFQKQCSFFSFGPSNDPATGELNEGLVRQKASFGGRGVLYETFARTFADGAAPS